MKPVVHVHDLKKTFRLPHDNNKSLKQSILSFRKLGFEEQKVLDGISFDVGSGEFFGILGRNGSGKSTLLKILAGIYQPTGGTIAVNGNLTPFIELGIGFNPELNGRDNIFLNGAILGLPRKEIEQKYDEIVHFAELERFMDQKLRNYSSGMQVRLAFSIAIQAHNEVLLIDEVLAVGDANFQQKCLNVFRELKRSGKTVILVTHDMGAVEEFCERAILIDQGKIIASGKGREIANLYRRLNFEQLGDDDAKNEGKKRWGNGQVSITDVRVTEAGKKAKIITDKHFSVTASMRADADVSDPVVGIQIRDAAGQIIIGTNSKLDHDPTKVFKAGQTYTYNWDITNILKSGKYWLTVAAHDYSGEPYDWWEDAVVFTVQRGTETSALADPDRVLKVTSE